MNKMNVAISADLLQTRYIRHSAPISGINLAISLPENSNNCLVSRVQPRHQRLRISDITDLAQ